jgi:hypothetical protein
MSCIVYYSNYCEPSKKLLQTLAKSRLKEQVHFICIDQRFKDAQNRTMIELNGQVLTLPACVSKVPALYLIDANRAVYGDDIYKQFAPAETAINHVETRGHGEPECFNSNMTTMSDAYSYWDQPPEELEAKGNGGMRQIHNFAPIDQHFSFQTPKDDYEPDKVGKKGTKTLEEYKAEREMAVPQPIART